MVIKVSPCSSEDAMYTQEHRSPFTEVKQYANSKLSKVLFPSSGADKLLLLGQSTGRSLVLWRKEEDSSADPFIAVSTANISVDPIDACQVKNDLVGVSFVDGSVSFVSTKDDVVVVEKSLNSVHNGSEGRVISLFNNSSILSGSSNGSLASIDIEKGSATTVFSGQGGLRSLCHVPSSSIVYTGHVTGQIAKWDLRENNKNTKTPVDVVVPSQDPLVPITSLCIHPAQTNLICFGNGEGVVGVINEKANERIQLHGSYIVTESEITQASFHPTCNDNLLVTTKQGSLLRLDASAAPTIRHDVGGRHNVWLGGSELANALRVEPLRTNAPFGLNSFDCKGNTVIASSYVGCVYVYEHLPFFTVV